MTDFTDHSRCPPGAHDRDMSGGQEQRAAPDGFMACNGCSAPIFYCRETEWYHHVDPEAGCWGHRPWGWAGLVATPMRPDDSPADMSQRCPGCGYPKDSHESYTDCDYDVGVLMAEIDAAERDVALDQGEEVLEAGAWVDITRAIVQMSDASDWAKSEVLRMKGIEGL